MEAADEAGLRQAFLAHGGELLGFARRSLYSSNNAEDAVQETFARAWRSRRALIHVRFAAYLALHHRAPSDH